MTTEPNESRLSIFGTLLLMFFAGSLMLVVAIFVVWIIIGLIVVTWPISSYVMIFLILGTMACAVYSVGYRTWWNKEKGHIES